MKIALPTMTEEGLEATISSHFGQTPFFTYVDSDTGEVSCEPNGGHIQAPEGMQTPAQAITAKEAGAVICGGLGSRAVEMLAKAGIQVYVGAQGTVQEALDALRNGQLQEASASGACPDGEAGH